MANKSYRNKPNRDKRNRTRKEKNDNLREVPSYVWDNIQPTHVAIKTLHSIGKCHLTLGENRNK